MIQFLRGNKSQLEASQTIFGDGQPIFEKDTGQLKVGNGVDVFSSLPYVGASSSGGYVFEGTAKNGSLTIGNMKHCWVYTKVGQLVRASGSTVAIKPVDSRGMGDAWQPIGSLDSFQVLASGQFPPASPRWFTTRSTLWSNFPYMGNFTQVVNAYFWIRDSSMHTWVGYVSENGNRMDVNIVWYGDTVTTEPPAVEDLQDRDVLCYEFGVL